MAGAEYPCHINTSKGGLKSLDRLRGHPLFMSAHLRAGPFRALKMRRVPEEAVFCTARIFRTVEACFWYRVLSQRHFSRPHIFWWGENSIFASVTIQTQ